MKSIDRPPEQGAVAVAQEIGQTLIDVGDHPPVVGHPDAFLGHIHQLLESLLAFLQGAGSFFEPGLSSLERRGMSHGRSHEAAQQSQRLGVPLAEGVGLGRDHLEHAECPVLVLQGHDQDGANAQFAVGLVRDPGVGLECHRSAGARRCVRRYRRGWRSS